jgi:hypothetical protein
MKNKRPFSLIPAHISHDTVGALKELLEGAQEGEVIGLAYAVIYRHRNFAVSACGEAFRSPVFTVGCVQHLHHTLIEMARA